ncbi:MAG: DUF998 domain-containing protein [Saprospiraceae bacterium]|nr:DUF998 domain-containing protein [Saprospiraceae bacterium]
MKYLALGGVAGPIVFAIAVIVCAGLREGYSHSTEFISHLGATGTDHAGLFNLIGFGLGGILITLFAVSLFGLLPRGFTTRAGSMLILLFGLGMILVGIYSCEPGCQNQGSVEGTIHDNISVLMFNGVILGIALQGLAMRRRGGWQQFRIYTFATVIALVALLIVMIHSVGTSELTGLWQRLFLFTLFAWIAAMGWRLAKST